MLVGQAATLLKKERQDAAVHKMNEYVISYDLHSVRTYQPVWARLESWGATRLLESLWVLTSGLSAVQIRDQLNAVMDADDAVVVLELKLGSNWATNRAKPAGVQWLKQKVAA